jgi:hypothetical protein
MTDFTAPPSDLPRPVYDGARDHLPGLAMPPIRPPWTAGPPGEPGRARFRTDRDLLRTWSGE